MILSEKLTERGPTRGVVYVHNKRGICIMHEDGARRKWKPVRVSKVGTDGKTTFQMKREIYFECDVGPREGGLLDSPGFHSRRQLVPGIRVI